MADIEKPENLFAITEAAVARIVVLRAREGSKNYIIPMYT